MWGRGQSQPWGSVNEGTCALARSPGVRQCKGPEATVQGARLGARGLPREGGSGTPGPKSQAACPGPQPNRAAPPPRGSLRNPRRGRAPCQGWGEGLPSPPRQLPARLPARTGGPDGGHLLRPPRASAPSGDVGRGSDPEEGGRKKETAWAVGVVRHATGGGGVGEQQGRRQPCQFRPAHAHQVCSHSNIVARPAPGWQTEPERPATGPGSHSRNP